jgi:hypothetical protein
MIIPLHKRIPDGYAVYDIDEARRAHCVCRWWLYPIFRVGYYLRELKYTIYRWLYNHGTLHTPLGEQVSLRRHFKIVSGTNSDGLSRRSKAGL